MKPSMSPLQHLGPGCYAVVMGLCGLSLSWQAATVQLGAAAHALALALGGLAAVAFALLLVATLMRGWRHPQAWAADRQHPVRHTFIATFPAALILLAMTGLALGAPLPPMRALWWAGSGLQLAVTLWVLVRWFDPKLNSTQRWASATPALLIPIVGNVLAPQAGLPLGHSEFALAQFGIGVMFWPVLMALLLCRIASHGLWPDRLLPTTVIFIAPASLVGLTAWQLGAPPALCWMLWGMAMFSLLWVGSLARRIARLPFGLPHWAMSFPLTAIASLTLRLAGPAAGEASGPPAHPLMAALGIALLLLASAVICALLLATLRGLVRGDLLVAEPEPSATLPVSTASPAQAA